MVVCVCWLKQKTSYEMRISDWSSDVCSADLPVLPPAPGVGRRIRARRPRAADRVAAPRRLSRPPAAETLQRHRPDRPAEARSRSEGHRVGKESDTTFRSRWWPYAYNKHKTDACCGAERTVKTDT